MVKRIAFVLGLVAFSLFLSACNDSDNDDAAMDTNEAYNDHSNDDAMNSDVNNDDTTEMNHEAEEAGNNNEGNDAEKSTDNEESDADKSQSDRMVIYEADMILTVNDFTGAQNDMQSLIDDAKGYIVNSSISNNDDDNQEGQITARIPQEGFNDFLDDLEGIAAKVQERNVTGEDVTKEYVDLESRLKAKKDVKKRLDTLMEEAEDTDALLNISNKLGDVQEEIEELKGQMEYLENHSSMSTVHITMSEDNVDVGGVKKWEELNTWEKTKKVLVGSTNALITFFSSIVIFLVGSSPILVPLLIIVGILYWIYRKRRGKEK